MVEAIRIKSTHPLWARDVLRITEKDQGNGCGSFLRSLAQTAVKKEEAREARTLESDQRQPLRVWVTRGHAPAHSAHRMGSVVASVVGRAPA